MDNTNRRVVVTGLGAVTPLGLNVEDTWQAMMNCECGIAPITLFDASKVKGKVAAEVKGFNPRDYMEKAEVLRADRFTHFAIAAADQAVKESGLLGAYEPERIATYFGSGIGGMTTFETETRKLIAKGPARVSPFFVPMEIANMAAGQIAIRFNFQGPALPAVTACASGSNAIGEALRLIRHGYADAVITGGTEAPITELGVAGFANMQALSLATDPMAACLPFDKRRTGFVMGEGAAALVLEEYEHAKARGAHIYAEVAGYGSTCDAYHITAIRMDAKGGTAAMVQATAEAGYKPGEKVYVNAHGTGTPLNDICETLAIKNTFGERAYTDVVVSSTKSMTGHMLGAAGAIEAIVCIKTLETGIVAPTIHLEELDEKCDLDYVPNAPRKADIDLCVSNSFGFGGHNACLAFRKI